jgi:hypothetical protein
VPTRAAFCAVFLCLAACAPGASSVPENVAASTTSLAPPPTTVDPYRYLPTAERRRAWEALGIDDYRITYTIRNPNGMGGSGYDGIYDVVVEDGVVVACTLEDAGWPHLNHCGDRPEVPVDVLFGWVDRLDPEFTEVRYDPELHLPRRIDHDDPVSFDEEYFIRILQFHSDFDPADTDR